MTTEADVYAMRGNAILAYERGMNLDLNEYYCSSNLPQLYRARNETGDARKADLVLSQVMMACDRGLERGASDEWLRPTLLTAAFDAGDADKAEALTDDVEKIGVVPYKLETRDERAHQNMPAIRGQRTQRESQNRAALTIRTYVPRAQLLRTAVKSR
jgi:hypothetical protein